MRLRPSHIGVDSILKCASASWAAAAGLREEGNSGYASICLANEEERWKGSAVALGALPNDMADRGRAEDAQLKGTPPKAAMDAS